MVVYSLISSVASEEFATASMVGRILLRHGTDA